MKPHPLPHPLTSSKYVPISIVETLVRFQGGTPASVATGYRRPKRVNPVWKGSLSATKVTPRIRPETTPPSSPLHLTCSQLTSLTNTSPLSPNTLNSSRLNLEDTLNKAPPPSVVRSPGQEVYKQEGTIVRARKQPRCQRIPLVAMTTEGRIGGYNRDEVSYDILYLLNSLIVIN